MDRLILGLFAGLFALTAQAAGASSENLSSALAESVQEQSQTYAKIREALGEAADSGSHMKVVYKSTPHDADFQIQLVQQKPRKRTFLVKNYKK